MAALVAGQLLQPGGIRCKSCGAGLVKGGGAGLVCDKTAQALERGGRSLRGGFAADPPPDLGKALERGSGVSIHVPYLHYVPVTWYAALEKA